MISIISARNTNSVTGSIMLYMAAAAALLTACAAEEPGIDTDTSRTDMVLSSAAAEKDLAILLPLDAQYPIRATQRNAAGERFLPAAWYQSVLDGYAGTLVADALEIENWESDWIIVSARMAPCSPLGVRPRPENDALCWPEVRLVWQPVVEDVTVGGIYSPYYADDRAIHALYDVRPSIALGSTDASRASTYLSRLTSGGTLTQAELADFVALRNRVTNRFLDDVLALRGNFPASAYAGHGLRPETYSASDEQAFGNRFRQFLGVYAPAASIKTLTSFSLPEGRQPALLDEWVFLAFRGQNGSVVPDDIRVHSAVDGRVLINLGHDQRASMTSDDPRFYEDVFSDQDRAELGDSVALGSTDPQRLLPSLRDRRVLMVPNTSCASCHKLNNLRFDFHNLSYLEDRAITISPRVVTDVMLDLEWLGSHLGN